MWRSYPDKADDILKVEQLQSKTPKAAPVDTVTSFTSDWLFQRRLFY